jgi:hypothetical protein
VKTSRTRDEPPASFPSDGGDLERLLGDCERTWVVRALEHTGGVRKRCSGACKGVSFRSLRYRPVKLGIDRDEDASKKGRVTFCDCPGTAR